MKQECPHINNCRLLLIKILKTISKYFWISIKILMIGLIAGLAGMQSKFLIYALNKPFGIGYAHYASYIEAGLIGAILFSYMFNNEEEKQ